MTNFIPTGYEIEGIEKIPDQGPAIIVMYHAEHACDAAFFNSEIFLRKKRPIVQIVHRLAFRIPGFATFIEACEWISGTVDSCVAILKKGDLLTVFPGGATEAFLSDKKYTILWPRMAGFAKIAIQAKVVRGSLKFMTSLLTNFYEPKLLFLFILTPKSNSLIFPAIWQFFPQKN